MIIFNQVLRRVEGSDEFKNFKKENEDAYLCSGFFVIDFGSNNETKQLDYYIPSKNKIASFLVDVGIKFIVDDIFEERKKTLNEINPDIKIGIQEAINIAKETINMENKKGKKKDKINKIIAILQKLDKEQIWNIIGMLGTMEMMLMHIDSQTGKVLKNEKAALTDFLRRVK